ncbi:MAG: hypothetical protein LBJ10_11190, partial [Clostridiales bacterium]|nr:hypothetical protein [Clostridiales bacterium]
NHGADRMRWQGAPAPRAAWAAADGVCAHNGACSVACYAVCSAVCSNRYGYIYSCIYICIYICIYCAACNAARNDRNGNSTLF